MTKGLLHIPAKVGSSRLIIKNLLPVGDRPSFYWPAMAAIDSGLFSEIVLTSELPDVIRTFLRYIPELETRVTVEQQTPSTLADTTHDVLKTRSYDQRISVALATAALLRPEDMRRAIALSERTGDPVMIVTRCPFKPDEVLVEDDNGRLRPIKAKTPREPLYVDAGSFYTFPDFRGIKDFLALNLRGYQVPRALAVDVDVQEDYELMQILHEHQALATTAQVG